MRAHVAIASLGAITISAACTVNFEGYMFDRGVGGQGSSSSTSSSSSSSSSSSTATSSSSSSSSSGCSLMGFSDEFNDASLSPCWHTLNDASGSVSIANGKLVIVPNANTAFYDTTDNAPFVYQEVEGDFAAYARVAVFDPSAPSNAPPSAFHAGGMLLRDASGTRRFVLNDVGMQGNSSNPPAPIEGVDRLFNDGTINSGPLVAPFGHVAELLICRVGNSVTTAYRAEQAGQWQSDAKEYMVTGLPTRVQIGLQAHCYNGPADARAEVELFRIHRITSGNHVECQSQF